MSTVSNDLQHAQQYAHGQNLSINTSECPVLSTPDVSDDLQHAQQHVCSIELNRHTTPISQSQSDTTQQIRGQHQNNGPTFKALNYVPPTFINTTNVGSLTVTCSYCRALRFPLGSTGLCCSNGKVVLLSFPHLPPYLQSLFDGSNLHSTHFLANFRRYNCTFQATSFGCNEIIVVDSHIVNLLPQFLLPQTRRPSRKSVAEVDRMWFFAFIYIDSCSPSFPIRQGVHQGAVLSPLLYS